MKKLFVLILILFFFAGCATEKKIDGTWFGTTGLATEHEKHPCVHYRFVVGNLIWSIILIQTVVAPVYFIGWSLYEPVEEKYKGCLKAYKIRKKL